MKPLVLLLAGFSLLLSGCSDPQAEQPPFSIELSATSDDGQPLSGVIFSTKEKRMGTTPESGSFMVQLRAAEGSTLPLAVQCPSGYESPLPASLRLTRVQGLSGKLEALSHDAVCTRQVRDVLVVVHAEQGSDIPVSIDGETKGKTDEHGNAHFLVSVDRTVRSLAISLDTKERALLRPQNPRRVFELSGKDAIAVFHQPFTQAPQRRRLRSVSRAPRHVPYRVK